MSLILFGVNVSPFVRKVRTTLAEKQIDYTMEQVHIFSPPPWFEEISPMRRIPVLKVADQDEPNTIPDSSAICAYLEKQYPEISLLPEDPFLLARTLWFEEYADTELAMTVGLGVFRPIVLNKLTGKEPNLEKAKATIEEKLPKVLDYLNKEITDKSFFVGDKLSLADIAVATHFVNLEHAGVTVDETRWPHLANFVKQMHERPSFKTLIAEELTVFRQPPLKF